MQSKSMNFKVRLWISFAFLSILGGLFAFSSYNNLQRSSAETAVHPDKLNLIEKVN